jgi:SWI/SNF-related matrix-associated actin-dependent regulator of chromatin subfamily A3
MPRPAKRPREVIDLTDEAQDTRPAKSPRYPSSSQHSAPSFSQQSFSSARVLSGSQRSTGQSASADYDLEPSTQDLTQRDEEPQRELYGFLGMHLASKSY